ncbi:MAG: ATP-binding protein [Calditerrivibrio sp.]|nr:ATP-binding protein [Calditerrivibrio sp.]
MVSNISVSNHIVSSNFPWYSNIAIFLIINVNLVLLLILAVVIFRNIGKLFLERKSSIYGAKLKTKLVVFSALLTILPVVVVFLLSNSIINKSIDKWFDAQIELSLKSSVELYQEYQEQIKSEVIQQAKVLSQLIASKGFIYNENFPLLKDFAKELINSKRADGLIIYKALRIVIINEDVSDFLYKHIGEQELSRVLDGEDVNKMIVSESEQVYISGSPLMVNNNVVGALFIYKRIPNNQLAKASRILTSYENYKQLKVFSQPIKHSYKILLFLMTLLVSFAGIWGSIVYAKNITTPLEKLLKAYNEVEKGNLNIYLEKSGDDEVSMLIESFNHMVLKLKEHTEELNAKNKALSEMFVQISKDNQYIDTIFKNVGAAIFLFDNRLKALKINHAAKVFIDDKLKLNEKIATHIRDFVKSNVNEKTIQVEINIRNDIRTYSLGMTKLYTEDGRLDNIIVVIDDITDVVYVQRVNIWRDIATRMAHEIKNPLTPIKLNAERIYHKVKDLSDEKLKGIISEGMQTIINEVSELQKLVAEFNDFARLPALKKERFQFIELINSVLSMYKEGFPDVVFSVMCDEHYFIYADRMQIKRVLVNLISNALHAIKNKGLISISVIEFENYYEIVVADNGHGIPEDELGRIFLPYFSKRPDGTGLGLAIVKKIVDEHGGKIYAKSEVGEWTKIIIELPKGEMYEDLNN